MLKLTIPDLPATPPLPPKAAPGFRVYASTIRPLAPIAKIDFYAQYAGDAGFQAQTEFLTTPDLVGRYYQAPLAIGMAVESVQAIAGFTSSDPLLAAPGTYWFADGALHLYALPTVLAGTSLLLDLKLRSSAPTEGDSFTVPIGFTVQAIDSLGLAFRPAANPSAPVLGEFTQAGNTVTLKQDAIYRARPLDRMDIAGSYGVTLGSPIAAVATFDMAASSILYLDTIDYLGVGFTPARNSNSPEVGEFLWRQGWTSLFLPIALGGGLKPRQRGGYSAQSGYGTITYLERQ